LFVLQLGSSLAAPVCHTQGRQPRRTEEKAAASAIALWTLNRPAWRWAHDAVLASEAVAADLFRTHNLHIRDKSGKMQDAED
jgi:hypothetical protein